MRLANVRCGLSVLFGVLAIQAVTDAAVGQCEVQKVLPADGATGDLFGISAAFDGSGETGFTDLLALLSAWGPCS